MLADEYRIFVNRIRKNSIGICVLLIADGEKALSACDSLVSVSHVAGSEFRGSKDKSGVEG